MQAQGDRSSLQSQSDECYDGYYDDYYYDDSSYYDPGYYDDPYDTGYYDYPEDIGGKAASLSGTSFYYNGSAIRPDVTVAGLSEGRDFVVFYSIDGYELDEYDHYARWDVYDEHPWSFDELEDHSGVYHAYVYGMNGYSGYLLLAYDIYETIINLGNTPGAFYRYGTYQLKPSVSNANGNTTYTSSNPKAATISAAGKITGVSKGVTTITVKNGYAKRTFKLSVRGPEISKAKASVYVNNTLGLAVNGVKGKPVFSTSNRKIATVDANGKVVAKKKGKCTITAKADGQTFKCAITVIPPAMSRAKLTTYNSYDEQLRVLGATGKVTWKSSNKKVATVNSKGVVIGKKAGKCTITAKCGKYKVRCKVTVSPHYEDYPKIPDFGAMYGKTDLLMDYEDGAYHSEYKATKSQFNKYIKKLRKSGFWLYDKGGGVQTFINRRYDIVAVGYARGRTIIVYRNVFDDDDDDY